MRLQKLRRANQEEADSLLRAFGLAPDNCSAAAVDGLCEQRNLDHHAASLHALDASVKDCQLSLTKFPTLVDDEPVASLLVLKCDTGREYLVQV